MELCCSVNGNRKCNKCRRTWCDAHVYQLKDAYVFATSHEYMCHSCYGTYVRKPFIESPREGMTFTELYQAVRQITPIGYISIEVKLQDHRPGVTNPEMQWSIYHEKLNHSVGKTPEQALAMYKSALVAWTDKSSPIANVNV